MPKGKGRGGRAKNEGKSSKRGAANHRHGHKDIDEAGDSDIVHRLGNVELGNESGADDKNSSSGM